MSHLSELLMIVLFVFKGSDIECYGEGESVKYYEALIRDKVDQYKNYTLPTNNSQYVVDTNDKINYGDIGKFDFIIVGAGSAGSVLAKRLSEVVQWKILVLEAGDEEDDFTDILAMAPYLQTSEKNWGYYTTPQDNSCYAKNDRRCFYPRGKGIGGTSIINSGIYSRAPKSDFYEWEKLGLKNWSYDKVLPYYKKSEDNRLGGNPEYHGFGGPLPVVHRSPKPSLLDVFIEANKYMNVTFLDDPNNESNLGVSIVQMNELNGRRHTSGRAFLSNASEIQNLRVFKNTLVIKVLFDEEKRTAVGVQFIHDRKVFQAKCLKEVIISGGAINSPQLLMLSGVGPKAHLESFGIDVIKDLRVGENLKDHVMYANLNFKMSNKVESALLVDTIKDYLQGTGFLPSGKTAGMGFIKVDSTSSSESADTEYIFLPPEIISDLPGPSSAIGNIRTPMLSQLNAKQVDARYKFGIAVVHLKEKSSGRILLKSRSPLDFPLIDTNILSDPEKLDQENLYRGIQFVLNLVKTKPFRDLDTELLSKVAECEQLKNDTKAYWDCAMKFMAAPAYHTCCSTRMGLNETDSVVDEELKVHGIKGLRVADAGVIPVPIAGHTYATTVMISEKISDSIKKEYFSSV